MMSPSKINSLAHPNIAFIKYWGNRDDSLRLPVNGSISMNLDGLCTSTWVEFKSQLDADTLTLNQKKVHGPALNRVQGFLHLIRQMAGRNIYAEVVSTNNFPTGAGIASSASAFAALALAGSQAIGLELSEVELTRLARRGSGSACRSIPDGFVEWYCGENENNSYAVSIASVDAWNLVDCIALVSAKHKEVGSSAGHKLAASSPLQNARIQDAPRRLDLCRRSILDKDFQTFADIVELDCNLMHAVMMTSTPALFYWEPQTLEVMQSVRRWRKEGIPVCYTLDAGANVHIICLAEASEKIKNRLKQMIFIKQVITAQPGCGARIVPS
jgi:diphosphomevalonate decarboxylase